MIIRSQDKKTITTDLNLSIYAADFDCYCICNIRSLEMGVYSTKEKAIKVLDMIQNKYFEHMTVENNGAIVNVLERPKVFQMPQDSEV